MSKDEPIAADTDNLDEFEKLFNGEEADTEPQVTPEQDEDEPAVDGDEEDTETDEDADDEEIGDDTPAEEEEADEEEDDDDADDGQDDDATQKKKQTAQERVQQAVARQREAERERDALLSRIEALEARDPKEETKPTASKTEELSDDAPQSDAVSEDGEPLYPLGDIDPKYIRDLTKWSAQKANEEVKAEAQAAEQQRQMEEANRRLATQWEEKLEASIEDIPNVREKGQQLENTFRSVDPEYGQLLAGTIMTLDYGPHVIDYLADNPNEAQDIVNSGPVGAAIKLGSLNERLAGQYAKPEGNKPKRKVSKAPKPAPANKGTSRPKIVAADTDNLDDFEKLFNQR